MKISAYVKSMRLRTLPLSESGVILGLSIASSSSRVGFWTAFLLILTTALLQILSNLSNELGDNLSGTDGDSRQGIRYSLQDGGMTIPEMKRLIGSTVVFCCLSGLAMIYTAFGTFFAFKPVMLIALGASAIFAAMRYTLGRNPYGYRGLGDVFVFVFFGLVSVCGAYFVCSGHLPEAEVLLPACGIGFFSVGVLNVNNIRDMKTDALTRTTVAIKLGHHKAVVYQTVLVCLGWICLIVFNLLTCVSWKDWIFLLAAPLFVIHLRGVWTKVDKKLDPMLPLLVMGSFIASVLVAVF